MRVNTGSIVDTLVADVSASSERLARAQAQLSSGKRLIKPSDDPRGLGDALSLHSALGSAVQFQKNIADAKSFIGTADAALGLAGNLVRQARQIAIQGATDTLDITARQGLSGQISSIITQLGAVANSQHGSKYVFAGQRTNQPAFASTAGGYTYQGGSAATGDATLTTEIAPNDDIVTNATGDVLFGGTFTALAALRDNLANGQTSLISRDDLQAVDDALTTINSARASFGANVQRLDQTNLRLEQSHQDLTSIISAIEDADIPKTVVELNSAQTAYQSALAATARGFQQSLLDFVR